MVYLSWCRLAKTLQFLNQQENYYYHVACNRPSLWKEVECKSTVLFF